MSASRLPAGEVGRWRIRRHHPFGLEVESVERPEVVGVVDLVLLGADERADDEGFPPVGSVVDAVVAGYTPSGQLRLSTRAEDLPGPR